MDPRNGFSLVVRLYPRRQVESLQAALKSPAAVYGKAVILPDVPKTKAPLLVLWGEEDP